MPWKSMVASIGVGLVNNALSQNNSKDQRDWQESMWHKQNAYNHPAAQADRLRSAGLNPYLMTGAEPAGSAGSSPPAQTIPFENPLAYAKTFAEIDNLAANTNNLDLDSQMLQKKLAIADQEYQRGIVSFEEYKRKVELAFEEWEKSNPYTVERENKQADTANKEAQAALADEQAKKAESETKLNEALTETENALRDLKVASEKSQKAYYDAMSNSAFASAQKAIAEGRAVTQETERRAYIIGVGDFFGIDLLSLPPAAQNSILEEYNSGEKYWSSLGKSNNSDEHYNSAILNVKQILQRYMNSESAVLESEKTGYKLKFFGVGVDNSSGNTKNTNK